MKNKKYLIIVGMLSLALVGCGKYDYSKLEKEMGEKATKYYQDYIEGKVFGIDNHKITLEALSNAEVDIKNFDDKKCDKTSYSLIKVKLNEKGEPEGEIEVENHLTCEGYTTEEK